MLRGLDSRSLEEGEAIHCFISGQWLCLLGHHEAFLQMPSKSGALSQAKLYCEKDTTSVSETPGKGRVECWGHAGKRCRWGCGVYGEHSRILRCAGHLALEKLFTGWHQGDIGDGEKFVYSFTQLISEECLYVPGRVLGLGGAGMSGPWSCFRGVCSWQAGIWWALLRRLTFFMKVLGSAEQFLAGVWYHPISF